MRAWFGASFPQATDAQAQGWPPIVAGDHTLILAPTGSGKTLAAFLWGIDRLVTGSAIAVVVIAVVNLMHFSQGWVQFGYRFSNDFAPFALLLVALALQASRRRAIGYALIGVSIAVNLWGVIWGHLFGW